MQQGRLVSYHDIECHDTRQDVVREFTLAVNEQTELFKVDLGNLSDLHFEDGRRASRSRPNVARECHL